MQVDTGQFAALREDVAEMRKQLEQLAASNTGSMSVMQAMYQAGRADEREAIFNETAAKSQRSRGRRPVPRHRTGRPGYLAPVDGSAS